MKSLFQHMQEFSAWKLDFLTQIDALEHWVNKTGCGTSNITALIEKARRTLRNEHFTIACVGEFSRGKTELINALLYMGQGQRLLPSQPGRTTMCPTEIFWQGENAKNCVRLLPIETRKTSTPLTAFKKIPEKWFTVEFDIDDPVSLSNALGQVAATKQVTRDEAYALGFDDSDYSQTSDGFVVVPAWRHALLNIDHPLLRLGLRIVDTPGLNALGNEPELTLKILPDAHLIIFLLSADAGVTKSDWRIWQEHIQPLRDHCETATLVLLNKIDSFWEELNTPAQVHAQIEQLREITATQLSIPLSNIQPISVKQGLLAKSRQDDFLLHKSGLVEFENLLKMAVIDHYQELKKLPILAGCLSLVDENYRHLQQRLLASQHELENLRLTPADDVSHELNEIRERIRITHHNFHKQSLSLKMNQRMLDSQLPKITRSINASLIKREVARVQSELVSSWTTFGLAAAIGNFFESLDSNLHHLRSEIVQVNALVTSFYLRPEHGQQMHKTAKQHLLTTQKFDQRFNNLRERSETFKKSIGNLLTHKGALIERFISTLVSEVEVIFSELLELIEHWFASVLQPLTQNNHYQKKLLEHHMLRLSRLRNERLSAKEKLWMLQVNCNQLAEYVNQLHIIKTAFKGLEIYAHQEFLVAISPENETATSNVRHLKSVK